MTFSPRRQTFVGVTPIILETTPTFAQAYFALGVLLEGQQELGRARGIFEMALKLEERADTLTILGSIQFRLNDLGGAERSYRRSLELNPDGDEANLGFAEVLMRSDPGRALPYFRKALAIQPDDAGAHRGLGETLWRVGENDEAELHLRQAIRLNPRDPWAHDYLGHLLNKKGERRASFDEFCLATEFDPTIAMFWCDRADAAADLGDREEAERAYRRALSCAVDDGYCHLQYGAYLKRIGKLGRAKQYFRRAIALDPSLERAKRLLAELDHISSEPLP